MRSERTRGASGSIAIALILLGAGSIARASTYYWDTNGATAGWGAASGTWGTNTYWSTDATGASVPGVLVTSSTDTVFLGTGSLGFTASGTINVSGNQAAGTLNIGGSDAIPLTISGGTISATTINLGIATANGSSTVFSLASGLNVPAGTTTTVTKVSGASGYQYITGQVFGGGDLKIVNNQSGGYYFVDSNFAAASGTLEMAAGTNNSNLFGGSNAGGITLQVDSGAVIGGQNGVAPVFGALSGSGTVSACFYSNYSSSTLTVGALGTSTTYSGVIDDYAFSNTGSATTTFVKTGTGTLTLNGASTFTGGTTINSGIVQAGSSNCLGTYSSSQTTTYGQVTIQNGGALDINGQNNLVIGLTIAGAGPSGQGALVNTGTGQTSGNQDTPNIALSADATIGGTQNFYQVYAGYAADTLNLNGHTLTKAGTNTFFLATTTVTAGTVNIANGTFSQYKASNAAAADIVLGNSPAATLDLDSLALPIGSLSGGGASGGKVLAGAALTVGGDNNSPGAFAGVISGTGSLTKVGSGTLLLAGANTYSGSTAVSAGTLQLGTGAAGFDGSINGTSGVSNNAALIFNLAGSQAAAYAISGTGSLTKLGSGILTLSGNNIYSGATTVSGGVLEASSAAALPGYTSSGTVTVNGGATLALAAGGATQWTASQIAALTSGSAATFNLNSALGIDTSSANFAYPTNIAGTIGFTKLGGNSLALTGSESYTGTTTIAGGTLQIASGTLPGAITGGGALLAGPGTMTLSGSSTYSGGTTIGAGGMGTLVANFSTAGASVANILPAGGAVAFAAGTLQLVGSSGAANSQSLGNLNFTSGANTIAVALNGANSLALSAGTAWSRSAGATLNITGLGSGASFSATPGTAAGGVVVGSGSTAFATVNGSDWAAVSGGNIVALPSYTSDTWAAGNNTDVSNSGANPGSGSTTSTLRFSSAGTKTLTLTGLNTLQTGGILMTPSDSGNVTISGGSLTSASNELVVHQYNGNTLLISSTLTNNGANATSLTKTGSGTLELTAANAFTGGTTITAGTLWLANSTATLGSAGTITMGNGVGNESLLIAYRNTFARPIVVNNVSGGSVTIGADQNGGASGNATTLSGGITLNGPVTLNSGTQGDRLDFSGVISGTGNITVLGGHRLDFSNSSNTFTGNLEVSGANTLFETSTANCIPNWVNVQVDSGALLGVYQNTGMNALSGLGTIEAYSNNSTVTIGAAGGSGTFAGTIINNGGYTVAITKTGLGTQSFSSTNSYTGTTTLQGGTLLLDFSAGGAPAANILAPTAPVTFAGGTLAINGSGTLSPTGTQTIPGPTFAAGGGAVVLSNSGALVVSSTAWTHTTGGAVDFSIPAGSTVTTGTNNMPLVNGQIAGWATTGGTAFATTTLSGSNYIITSATPGKLTSTAALSTGVTADNWLVDSGTANATISSGTVTVNSLIVGGSVPVVANSGSGFIIGSGGVIFRDTGSAYTAMQTSSGSTGTLSSGLASGELFVAVPGGSATDRTLALIVANSGATPGVFVKTGAGSLKLSQSNTYTGGTYVEAGRLDLAALSSAGTGNITVANGAQLYLPASGTYTNNVSLAGIGTTEAAGNLGALRLENGVTLSGSVTLTGNAQVTTYSSGVSATISGPISGAYALTKTGSGTLTLGANSTYSGSTSVTAGTLYLPGDYLQSSSSLSVQSATVQLASQAAGGGYPTTSYHINNFTLNNSTLNLYQNGNGGAAANVVNQVAVLGADTVNQNNGGYQTAGFFSNGISGTGTLTLNLLHNKSDVVFFAGDMSKFSGTINVASVVSGDVVSFEAAHGWGVGSTLSVSSGTVDANLSTGNPGGGNYSVSVVATDINEPTSKLVVNSGGTFNTSVNVTIGSLNGNGGSLVTPSNKTLTVGALATTDSYAGIITGAGGFAKSGSGAMYLSGANSYAGGTTIGGGTLNINADAALGTPPPTPATNITFSGNGTLQAGAAFALSSSRNVSIANGVVGTIDTQGFAVSLPGAISGSGGLAKAGPGTLTLTGSNNSYSGPTSVAAGTLQLGTGASGQDGTLGATSTVANNAAIVYNLFGSQTANYAINGGGSLTLSSGTLALGGANSYAGATNVNNGTLIVNGTHAGGGAYTIAGGATLSGTGAISGPNTVTLNSAAAIAPGVNPNLNNIGTMTLPGLAAGGGATLDFDLTSATTAGGSSNDLINVTGNLSLAGTTTVAVNAIGTLATSGAYTLLNYGTLTNASTTSLALAPGLLGPRQSAAFSYGSGTNSAITLTITGFNANLTWIGSSSTLWDLNDASNTPWVSPTSPSGDFFATKDSVTFNNSTSAGGLTVTLSGALNPGSVTVTGTNNFVFNGPGKITNGTSLTVGGPGTLTLANSGGNDYTLGTNLQGGTIVLGVNNGLSAAGIVTFGSAASSGTLDLAGYNQQVGGLAVAGGASSIGQVIIASSGSSTLTYNGGASAFAGTMRDTASTSGGTLGLTVAAGTLDLTGASAAYSGATAVNGGLLLAGSLPNTSGYAIGAGGALSLSASNLTIAAISNSGNVSFTAAGGTTTLTSLAGPGMTTFAAAAILPAASSGTINFNGPAAQIGTLTAANVNLAAGTVLTLSAGTASGSINGAGNVNFGGTGTFIVSGANTYSGGTSLAGGTVEVASAAALGTSGSIAFAGGTLEYSASNTVDYSNRFVTSGSQAWNINTNGQTVTFGTALQGPGSSLTKTGGGTLILGANNNYTGPTNILAGTVEQGVATTFSTSTAMTISNATLQIRYGGYNINQLNVGSLTLAGGATLEAAPQWEIDNGDIGFQNSISVVGTNTVYAAGGSYGKHNWLEGGMTGGTSAYVYLSNGSGYGAYAAGHAIILQSTNWSNYLGTINAVNDVTIDANVNLLNANVINNGSIGFYDGGYYGAGNNLTAQFGALSGSGALNGNGTTGGLWSVGNLGISTTYSGVISGSGGLAKVGTGSLTLTASSTFTGGTTVSSGTLQLGTGASGQDGALSSNTTNNAALVYNLYGNETYSGAISGSGAVAKLGGGLLNLSGSNGYSGGTSLQTGMLQIGNTAALGSGALAANGGTLDLNGVGATVGSFSGAAGVVTDTSGTGSATTTLLTVNQATSTTFSGSFQTGPAGRTVSLLEAGSGSLNLAAASTLSGATVQNTAVLQLAGSLTAASVNVNAGAQLAGNGTINVTSGGSLNYASSAASTFAGSITGPGTVAVSNGTLLLKGIDTYSGGTQVFSTSSSTVPPVVRLGSSNALPFGAGAGDVTLGGLGTLDLAGQTASVNGLWGTGTVDNSAGNGTLIVGNGDVSSTFSGVLQNSSGTAAPLGLTKTGAGTITLAGTNLFTGLTTVQNGLLSVSNGLAGPAIVTGGTLDLSAAAQSIASLAIQSAGQLNLGVGNVITGTGSDAFAGTLDLVGAIHTGELMSYTGHSGTFAASNLPGAYQLLYGNTELDIVTSGPATWSSATSGSWNTGNNWTSGSAPSGVGVTAIVGTATGTNVSITLDTPQTLGTLVFSNTAGNSSAGYSLDAGTVGTGSLTLDNSGAAAQIVVNVGNHAITAPVYLVSGDLTVSASNGGVLTISGSISQDATRNLTLNGDGSGELVLSGTNNLGGSSGTATVSSGTLILASNEALADGTSLTVGDASAFSGIQPAGAATSSPPASISINPVPEPGSLVLLAVGAALAGLRTWRRKNN